MKAAILLLLLLITVAAFLATWRYAAVVIWYPHLILDSERTLIGVALVDVLTLYFLGNADALVE
jgi:hypothetical protein